MNLKQTLLLVFLLPVVFSSGIFAQNTFQKTVGGTGDDIANWVIETSNGYLVAGQNTIQGNDRYAYLLSIDNAGNTVWQRRYDKVYRFNVVVNATNGYLAMGESSSDSSNVDIFLVRTDLLGNTVWSKRIGDANNTDNGYSLIEVQGGYVLSGTQAPSGTQAFTSFLTRLDTNGVTLWSRSYSSNGNNSFRTNHVEGDVIYASGTSDGSAAYLQIDLNNGDILSTTNYDGNNTEALYYQQPTQDSNLLLADHTLSAGGTDMRQWVQKINKTNGQVLWSKVYARPGINLRGRIERISSGGFLLTPYANTGGQINDGMLAKIDSAGNVLWSFVYGGSQEEQLIKGTETSDGGFIAVGYSRTNSGSGDNDLFIVRTDSNGHVAGCCVRPAGITGSDYLAQNVSVTYTPADTYLADSVSIDPLNVNLTTEAFCTAGPPADSQTIFLCPNQSFTLDSIEYFAPFVVTDTLPASGAGCDTLIVYTLIATPYDSVTQLIQFCSGDSITIDGQVYTQSGTVVDTISTAGFCDTIVVYTLQAVTQFSQTDTIQFCPGDSITIGGQVYTQSGTVVDTVTSTTGACDTVFTYTLELQVQPTQTDTIQFCPGDSITINGVVYTQAGTVTDTIASGSGGCDTLITYTLELLTPPTQTDTIQFCIGDSITIGGQVYTQSGTVTDTIASGSGGCDTIVTYTLQAVQQFAQSETIQFCNGDSITIGGQVYTQSGTVVDTITSTTGGCDTVFTYTLQLLAQPTDSDTIQFCAGDSITINGTVYTQSGTVVDTVASGSGTCDTLVTYTLIALAAPTQTDTIQFCAGDSITINGTVYTQSGTVTDTIASTSGTCDTVITYTLELIQQPTQTDTIQFCAGDSITINGTVYTQAGTVVDTIGSTTGTCDTILTYILQVGTQPLQNDTIQFCAGDSITIGGQVYTQSGTVVDTVASSVGTCDTIITYTLQLLTQPTQNDTIQFCPGDSITINGVVYTQSATVIDTIAATSGTCDTLLTYTLVFGPQPTLTDTIILCSGDSITINGTVYSQPGTVVDTIASIGGGCDTIVTYVLQLPDTSVSNVTIKCPLNVSVNIPQGGGPAIANYILPTATSDCPCPGIAVNLTSGFASGDTFPVAVTQVCYTAQDSCGNTASCCFNVTVTQGGGTACDVKQIGCMKYEIISITKDAKQNHTYQIRVTNTCFNKMIWTAIQLPNGIVADAPLQNSVFTSANGRNYDVRNPNFSPFYSVRFKSTTDSIANGQSDVFSYTLPAQAGNPLFIHIATRLAPQTIYEAHLNTFGCPVGLTQEPTPDEQRDDNFEYLSGTNSLFVFPNPTSGTLYADLSDWQDQQLQVQIVNAQGQRVQHLSLTAGSDAQQIALNNSLLDGLYFLEIRTENGERHVARFVMQH